MVRRKRRQDGRHRRLRHPGKARTFGCKASDRRHDSTGSGRMDRGFNTVRGVLQAAQPGDDPVGTVVECQRA